MATIIEQQKDITEYFNHKEFYFAHCISSDCRMGAGIAPVFDKHFKLKSKLLSYNIDDRKHPTCIFVSSVYNLITKEYFYNKPTYKDFEICLYDMAYDLKLHKLPHMNQYLAMPRIGCGLDGLSWPKVKNIIENVFKDANNLEIIVCYL